MVNCYINKMSSRWCECWSVSSNSWWTMGAADRRLRWRCRKPTLYRTQTSCVAGKAEFIRTVWTYSVSQPLKFLLHVKLAFFWEPRVISTSYRLCSQRVLPDLHFRRSRSVMSQILALKSSQKQYNEAKKSTWPQSVWSLLCFCQLLWIPRVFVLYRLYRQTGKLCVWC